MEAVNVVMNPKMLIGGIVAILVIVAAIPLLNQRGSAPSQPSPQPAQQAQPPQQQAEAQPPAAPGGPAGSEAAPMPNLANTSWKYQSYTVHLLPGGKARAQVGPTSVNGTWRVNGNKVTAQAMGQSLTATWNGSTLVGADGNPLRRVR